MRSRRGVVYHLPAMPGADDPARAESPRPGGAGEPGAHWPAPDDAVERLLRSVLAEPAIRHIGDPPLPDRHRVAEFVELVREHERHASLRFFKEETAARAWIDS